MCYMGHQRFLPFKHKFRDEKINFDNKQEYRRPPRPLTGYQVEEKVANIKMKVGKDKLEIGRKRKRKPMKMKLRMFLRGIEGRSSLICHIGKQIWSDIILMLCIQRRMPLSISLAQLWVIKKSQKTA